MICRLIDMNGYQAILQEPILLVGDSHFADGFVDETAVIHQQDNLVELKPSKEKPDRFRCHLRHH